MPGFVLLVRTRGDGDPAMRLGITVTKKVGNAVVRNRMKRRFRELARAILPEAGHRRRRPCADRPRTAGSSATSPSSAPSSPSALAQGRADDRPAAHPGRARLADRARRGCCRRAAATSRAARPMQSPRFPAMARCAAAGWRAKRLLRCHPWGGSRPRPGAVREEGFIQVNEQQQHDPGDRPVGARPARLELRHRDASSRPPTAPTTKVEDGKQRAAAPAQGRSRPPTRPRAIRDRAVGARARRRGSGSRRRASPARSTSAARGSTISSSPRHRETHRRRIRRRSGCSRRPARPAPISPASAGPAQGARRCPDRDTVWQASGDRLTPARPVTLSWDNGQRPALPDRAVGRRRLSVHRRAARDQPRRRRRSPSRPSRSSAGSAHRRDPDSWTDACRPDRRVQRRRQLRQQLRPTSTSAGDAAFRHAPAAGSASPTNIGWPR